MITEYTSRKEWLNDCRENGFRVIVDRPHREGSSSDEKYDQELAVRRDSVVGFGRWVRGPERDTWSGFLASNTTEMSAYTQTIIWNEGVSVRDALLSNQLDAKVAEARLVLHRARADLGDDLGGLSPRDLLLDQIPSITSVDEAFNLVYFADNPEEEEER